MICICHNCGKKIKDAKCSRRTYCNNHCRDAFYRKDPIIAEKYRLNASKYYYKVKNSEEYKKKRHENYSRWYSREENKLKMKLYAREFQRKKLKITPDRYRAK